MGSVATSADLERLAANGRFATVLLRLARARFTGLLYVEREDGGAVISFRDGAAVFFEDLSGSESLGSALLREQRITEKQHAAIDARAVLDSTASEDAAFGRAAVTLGVLTREEVDAEIVRRIRGQLMQAATWESVRIDLDSDADSLAGPEYPQALAPLIFTAVRAFFEDDRLHALLGDADASYLRLLQPKSALCAELELDAADAALLEAIEPDRTLRAAIELAGADTHEAWQLVAMLELCEMTQRSLRPFARQHVEPRMRPGSSGDVSVPSSQHRREPPKRPDTPGRYVERSAIAEEHIAPIRDHAATHAARPNARAPSSQAEPRPRPASTQNARAVTGDPRQERFGSSPRYERVVLPSEHRRAPSSPRNERAAAPAAGNEAQPERTPLRPASNHVSPASTRAPSSPRNERLPAPSAAAPPTRARPASSPNDEPASSAPLASAQAPRTRSVRPNRGGEARPRRLGAALKRLGRELEARRTQQLPEPSAAAPPPAPAEAASVSDAGATAAERVAVRELIRMRRAQLTQQTKARSDSKPQEGRELLRQAQESLREQQFARAHELMIKACEAESDNEVFKLYRMWAAFRANAIEQAELSVFRGALREKLNDDLLKPFAFYAMAHLLLADKKDDQAEKFFSKAVELDKSNKDAERHLRLIELRRKKAAVDAKGNKIFGIEIGTKKS